MLETINRRAGDIPEKTILCQPFVVGSTSLAGGSGEEGARATRPHREHCCGASAGETLLSGSERTPMRTGVDLIISLGPGVSVSLITAITVFRGDGESPSRSR